LPRRKPLADIPETYTPARCTAEGPLEAIELQFAVSEYIGDIFVAYFGDKWASLPDKTQIDYVPRSG
jgi:hypothetical protein